MESLMSISQAAKIVGVSRSSMYARLPALRSRGLRIYRLDANCSPKIELSNLKECMYRAANQAEYAETKGRKLCAK